MKFLNILLIFLVVILFLNCEKTKNDINFQKYKKIDTFLVKANDDFLDKKTRLAFTDSVSFLLISNKNDTLYRYYQFKLANRFFNLNQLDRYKQISQKINKEAIFDNDSTSISKSYNYLGDYHYYSLFNIDSSYYYYQKANKFINIKTKEDLKLNIYRNIGNVLHFRNNYLESDIYITKALRIANQIQEFRIEYDCFTLIGLNQLGLKNYNEALDYFLKAENGLINLSEDVLYSTLKAQVYINYCNTYMQMEDYNKMFLFAKKGISIKNFNTIDIKTQAYLKNYYGYAKLQLGDKTSFKEFQETLKIGDSLQFKPIQNTSNLHLGKYYLFIKDTIKAINYFETVISNSNKANLVDDELKALHFLAKAEPNKNYHLKRIVFLNDSLIEVERKTRDKFSRIAFETDEIIKEKDIIEVDKNKVSSQRWIIIILSLFFILFLLFYYNLRIQKNKNKELEYIKEQEKSNAVIFELMLDEQKKIEEGKQIEKQRISKELHDGVMGKLTSIRLNLFVLSKRNDQETINKCLNHIDDIQQIEKEIRNIAHDLNKDIFSDNVNFISIVKNIFTSIENHSTIDFKLFIDENIDWESLESNIKMQIYRVLQEALLNIDKYADAKIVKISMKQKNNEIDIEIKDDGKGFDVNKPKNGIGLKNMKERIESIKGKFNIKSNKNEGTVINLIIPL